MLRAVLTLSLGAVLCLSAEVNLNELLADLHRERELGPFAGGVDYADDYPASDIDAARTLMARVRKGAGNCYAQGKCLYYSKRMKSEFCGTCGKPPGCFPGSGQVLKESGDVISMSELRLQDRVLAARRSGQLVFSPVVMWLDKRSNDTTAYLELQVQAGQRVQLSANHVMLVREGDQLVSRFAGDVHIGDVLKVATSAQQELWSPVVAVRHLLGTGAYVPLTAEGTIVVDGVLASCYASFDHDWSHALTTPLRWLPTLFQALDGLSDGNDDGPRDSVESLKLFGAWLFPSPGTQHRAAIDDSLVQLPSSLLQLSL